MKGLGLLRAVKEGLVGEIAKEQANLGIYMENPVGIGEHSNLVDEVCGFVDRLATAQDKLNMTQELITKFEMLVEKERIIEEWGTFEDNDEDEDDEEEE